MKDKEVYEDPFAPLRNIGTYKSQCNFELYDDVTEIGGKIVKCKKIKFKTLENKSTNKSDTRTIE